MIRRVRLCVEGNARKYSKILSAAIVVILILLFTGPKFHILVIFREVVDGQYTLSEFRVLSCSYALGCVLSLVVFMATFLLSCTRTSLGKATALAVIVMVLTNFIASLIAYAAKVYPAKIKVERLVEVVSIKTPVEAVALTVDFVNSSLNNSYRRPESILELNEQVGLLDFLIAHLLGLNEAHVILYQGWGSCGQYAILTSYILREAGYIVRIAKFKDRDHMWAEVLINGTWYIVDPWYIGRYYDNSPLIPASRLAEKFYSIGVVVEYPNGTRADASAEHGYHANSRS